MRQRILTVLGVAVALLALYTIAFQARPAGRLAAATRSAAESFHLAATQASGSDEAGEEADVGSSGKSSTARRAAEETPDANAERAPETWGSDPFVRDWVTVDELVELTLKAITIGGEKSYVLINDQILEEGDEISGKRIVTIEADKVTLEQGGRTFSLLLGE